MPAKRILRKYSITDAALKQRGDQLVNDMNRDAEAFATRNIGAPERDALTDLLETFFDIPDEIEGRGSITAAVEEKEELADKLKTTISKIRVIAESLYGLSGKYRRFGFAYMQKLTDEGLHRLARRVLRIGTELLPELSARGLTLEMLNNLQSLTDAYDQALETIHDRETASVIHTEERVAHGNSIWDMMGRYALVGKSLFFDTDEVRYKSYVLDR
jgi:hypothetical protein